MDNRNFTIASSAVLICLTITAWTGRKLDRATTREVTDGKNAKSARAASVTKNLLADDVDLDAIRAYAQETRAWLAQRTLPWGDTGVRLLPTMALFDTTPELEARRQRFSELVDRFVAGYATKVSAAAFTLGNLFKREEYPTEDVVRRRFRMSWVIEPVPTAGDFRVDVQADGLTYLQEQFEQEVHQRVAALSREPWDRVYETLKHVQDRMAEACKFADLSEGEAERKRAPKLFASMLDNARELTSLLKVLNVTNDPALDDIAERMRRVFSGVTIEAVRGSDEVKRSLKSQVDAILQAFDFSGLTGEEA